MNIPTRPRRWWESTHRRIHAHRRPFEPGGSGFAPLESRRLLSNLPATLGFVPLPAPVSVEAIPSPLSPSAVGNDPFSLDPATVDARDVNHLDHLSQNPSIRNAGAQLLSWLSPMPAAPIGDGPLDPSAIPPSPPQPGGWQFKTHPISSRPVLSEADLLVAGKPTPEVALADDSKGTVTVFVGAKVTFSLSGLNHPEDVKLADLTHDGTPDLIVADSGDNKVLVYPGLAGGGFSPEITGGRGFSVGVDPVGLSVGDINNDGQADLIVSNKGSNNVSILLGQNVGSRWTFVPGGVVQAGIAPVHALVVNPNFGSLSPFLLICNSGSNDVYFYETTSGGQVESQPSKIINVGQLPADLLVGHFGEHPNLDMVTLDSGSDSLTYIGGVFTPHPTRQVIPMDGSQPVSAVPLNINMSGSSDLMVASSDGRIALLQAGDTGLQLTGLASPTGQTNITSIAGGDPINGGFQIYEASSNPDSVAILQFNLQDASVFGGEPAISLANTINVGDNSLVVELIPNGNAMLDLVGVLWTESTNSQVTEDPAMPRNTVGARSTAQGLLRSTNPEDSDSALVQASSGLLAEEDRDTEPGSMSWTRFVLGLDAAFDSVAREVAAVSESDSWDHGSSILGSKKRLAVDHSDEGQASGDSRFQAGRFDFWAADPPDDQRIDHRALPRPSQLPWSLPDFDGSGSSTETSQLANSAVGSAIAVRLLINASPPRRPGSGRKNRNQSLLERESISPWPEIFPPTTSEG